MAASAVPAVDATVPQPDKSPKLINLDSPNSNSDPTPPISVTHFSPAVNGSGVQKETLFTNNNTNPFLQNGESDSSSKGGGGCITSKNPFSATNGSTMTTTTGGKYATIGRSNPFTKSSNPFLDNTLTNANNAGGGSGGGGGGGGVGSHVNGNTSSSSSNDASMEPIASTPVTVAAAAAAGEKTLNKIVSKFRLASLVSRQSSSTTLNRDRGASTFPLSYRFLSALARRRI